MYLVNTSAKRCFEIFLLFLITHKKNSIFFFLLEIWLVGKNYGPNSGRISLAKSFGNDDLKVDEKNIGGQLLHQGVSTNETDSIFYSRAGNKLWSDDFHVYKIEWTPGRSLNSNR